MDVTPPVTPSFQSSISTFNYKSINRSIIPSTGALRIWSLPKAYHWQASLWAFGHNDNVANYNGGGCLLDSQGNSVKNMWQRKHNSLSYRMRLHQRSLFCTAERTKTWIQVCLIQKITVYLCQYRQKAPTVHFKELAGICQQGKSFLRMTVDLWCYFLTPE